MSVILETTLLDRFYGKAPLISINVKTVRELKPLIDAIDRANYLLSKAVKHELKTEGKKIEDKKKINGLRETARDIFDSKYLNS